MDRTFCNTAQPVKSRQFDEDPGPTITIVSSSHGPIVKRFSLRDGKITSDPVAQIYRGSAETVAAKDPRTLLGIIEDLSANQALALGRLPALGVQYPLASDALRAEHEIARTKRFLAHPASAAWMLLDIDTKGLPEAIVDRLSCGDPFDAIMRAVPELSRAPYLVRPSSSAGVSSPSGDTRGVTGGHVFVLVAKGTDIPRLLNAIHDRLWVEGWGYFAVSKSGQLLERSLVDLAVGGAERLIFEAAPIVEPPLSRQPPEPRLQNVGEPLAFVSDVNAETLADLKAKARDAQLPDAKRVRLAYEDMQVRRLSEERRIPASEARRIVKMRLTTHSLSDDDMIEVRRGVFERVGDFLDRTTAPTPMPCPIEGSDYGSTTAYFYPADEYALVPRIVSFAHGQRTRFNFRRFRALEGLRRLRG